MGHKYTETSNVAAFYCYKHGFFPFKNPFQAPPPAQVVLGPVQPRLRGPSGDAAVGRGRPGGSDGHTRLLGRDHAGGQAHKEDHGEDEYNINLMRRKKECF